MSPFMDTTQQHQEIREAQQSGTSHNSVPNSRTIYNSLPWDSAANGFVTHSIHETTFAQSAPDLQHLPGHYTISHFNDDTILPVNVSTSIEGTEQVISSPNVVNQFTYVAYGQANMWLPSMCIKENRILKSRV